MFPVDLLTDVSHSELEESADSYMTGLLLNITDSLEQIAVSVSSKVGVDLSSVGFVPLYGANDKHKILALFSPTDPFTVVALYLLDRWWTVEDILRTTDLSRDGAVKVETVVDRIVLYVLNRVVYRSTEMNPKEELPFLCHGETDFAKICWSNGEAVGFYSAKPTGSLCNPPFGRSYQLPVMDSLFVRKLHRRKGFGLKMLEDFVLSFNEGCLGLRYPLTHVMFRVCEKYLSQYPGDNSLLWEVEGAGERTQRSSIFSRIRSMSLSAVSRSLLTELGHERSRPQRLSERAADAEAVLCSFEMMEEKTIVQTGKGPATVTTVSVCKKKIGDEVTEETSEKVIRIEQIEAESSEEHVCVQRETISTAAGGDEEDDQEEEDGSLTLLASDGSQNEDNVMVVIAEEVHDQSGCVDEVDRTSQESQVLLTSEEESVHRVTEGISLETTEEGGIDAAPLSGELQAKSDEVDGEGEEPLPVVLRSRGRIAQRRKGQKQNDETKLDSVDPEADSTSCGKQVAASEELHLPDLQRVSVVLVDLKIQQDIGLGALESAALESNLREPCSHPPEVVPQQKDGEDKSVAQEESSVTHSGRRKSDRVKRKEERAEDQQDEVMDSPQMVDAVREGAGEEHAEEPGEDQHTEQDAVAVRTVSVSVVDEGALVMEPESPAEPDSLTVCEDSASAAGQCLGRTVSVVLVDLNIQSVAQETASVEDICDGNTPDTDLIQGQTEETGDEAAPGSSVEEPADKQSMEKVSLILDEANIVTRRLRSSGRVTTETADRSSEEDGEVQERVLRKDRRYNLRTPKRVSYHPRRHHQTEHQRSGRDQQVGDNRTEETSEGQATLQTEDGVKGDVEMETQEVHTETFENVVSPAEDTAEQPSGAGQLEENTVGNSGNHQSEESSSQPSELHSVSAVSIQEDEDDGGLTRDISAEEPVEEKNTQVSGSDSKQPDRHIDAEEEMKTQEMVEGVSAENEGPISVAEKGACENSDQDTSAEEMVSILDTCSGELGVRGGVAEPQASGQCAEVTGSEPMDPDERGDEEAPDATVEAAPESVASGEEPDSAGTGDNSELAVVMEIDVAVADSTSAQLEEDDLEGGKVGASQQSEVPEAREATITVPSKDGGEHQLLHAIHEVCDAAPHQEKTLEDQSDEGSLAEEQAPGTAAEAEPVAQQVNETLDDKVAADEATETSEEPEEAPITSTRVLRSGKKITRAAASQSDDGSAPEKSPERDESKVQQRVLTTERKSSGSTPRRASKRARRVSLESEDEDETADEKIPADTSLQMFQEVQEEDKIYKECDVSQEGELRGPVVEEIEVQEPAASTSEEKDTTLFEPLDEPQTGDEELPQVEESPLPVTRKLRSGGKTVRSTPRTRSRKGRTSEVLEKDQEGAADEKLEEDGLQPVKNSESSQGSESVGDGDDDEGSAEVLSAEKNEDIAAEESEVNVEQSVEQNSAEPEEDATERPGRESDECDPTAHAAVQEQSAAPAQELLDAGLDQVESQQMLETPQETITKEEVSLETGSLSGDGMVVSTANMSESEEEPSRGGSSNEPEPNIHPKVRGRKRKSRQVKPQRKSTRAKRQLQSDEEEIEEMTGDVEVPPEALVDQGHIEEEGANEASLQAPEDLDHEEQNTSAAQETEAAPEQMEESAEETDETEATRETAEGLEPEMEHQLHHEVCDAAPLQEKTPEDRSGEGSLAEEQAPGTAAEAEPVAQQVNETLDDKVAADEATEISEEPEEAPITITRVLRSGKKITRAAASQSDDGSTTEKSPERDERKVQQRVLRTERKSSGSTPRRASKRARRVSLESEDEDETADEKIPADTSLQMFQEVQEEDQFFKECDVSQEGELRGPVVEEIEVQEPAASTSEEKDTTLFEPLDEPQTGDEELPQVEESPLPVTRKLRSGGKTVRSTPRTRSRKGRTSEVLEKDQEGAADEKLEEDGLQPVKNSESSQGSESVGDGDDDEGSEEVLSAEKNEDIAAEVPPEALVDQGNIEEEGANEATLQAPEDLDHEEQNTSAAQETEAAPEQMEESAEETDETEATRETAEGLEPEMEHLEDNLTEQSSEVLVERSTERVEDVVEGNKGEDESQSESEGEELLVVSEKSLRGRVIPSVVLSPSHKSRPEPESSADHRSVKISPSVRRSVRKRKGLGSPPVRRKRHSRAEH